MATKQGAIEVYAMLFLEVLLKLANGEERSVPDGFTQDNLQILAFFILPVRTCEQDSLGYFFQLFKLPKLSEDGGVGEVGLVCYLFESYIFGLIVEFKLLKQTIQEAYF